MHQLINVLAIITVLTWLTSCAATPGTGAATIAQAPHPRRPVATFSIVARDPKTGEIIFRHGGTYRLSGDILEQKVEFATFLAKQGPADVLEAI